MPRRPPDYRRIADDIRSKIADGVYAPGSRLPTYRELGEIYETSDQPVRAALGQLSAEGWIETQQGKGSFVAKRPPQLGRDRESPAVGDPD